MSGRYLVKHGFNATYLTVRLVLWTTVALAALIDFIIHRNEKPRGWQLHRAISAVLLVYVVQEVATTLFVYVDGSDSMYDFMIFVYNLADSLFLGVLLIISCGWQITRDSFEKRKFIFLFPPIHFGCSVTVDYILDKYIGHENSNEEVAVIPNSTERTVLIFAYFGSIITLFYGWWWIFTCLAIERTELQKKINTERERDERENGGGGGGGGGLGANGAYDTDDDDSDRPDREPEAPRARLTSIDLGSDGAGDDEEEVVYDAGGVASASPEGGGIHNGGNGGAAAGGDGGGGAEAGSARATRRRRKRRTRAERARARAGQLGESLISGGGNDDDEGSDAWGGNNGSPSVDHSSMPDRAKLRMLTQYGWMVQMYLFIILFVLLVNAWREDRPVWTIVLLEMLNWFFLAGLLFTFRLRATNPYYMLDEHDYHDDSYGMPRGVDAVPERPFQLETVAMGTFEIGDEDEDEEV